jgi:hypothetical protein
MGPCASSDDKLDRKEQQTVNNQAVIVEKS